MSFFKNKHVITAMIVAPLLAIISYYSVDYLVKEKPGKPVAGQSYKLIAKSNCRFSSGVCNLENGNFKSSVTVTASDGKQTLVLKTNNSIQQAVIGFVTSDGQESGPFEMLASNSSGTQWVAEFSVPANADTTMRLVLSASDAHYFSETSMAFSTYASSYNKDFRQ